MTIVRSRRQKQLVFKKRTDFPQYLYKLVVLPERRRQEIVGFINNQQILRELCLGTATCKVRRVTRCKELLQNVGLPKVIVGSDNARVCSPGIGIKAYSALKRMRFCPIDEIKIKGELGLHLPLPLLSEGCWGQDQDPANAATD
jgi:hypothetical protein